MTKTMKLGDKLASDLRAVIKSLSALADSIEGATPSQANDSAAAEPQEKKLQAPPAESNEAVNSPTLEQVRVVLAEKSRAGHTAKIRELLLKHGAAKLSEIDAAKYPALLADAEGLTNG